MSMPSSSELVATRQGSSPAFSSSSTFVRSSRASEPWWARAISWRARRSSCRPRGRELVQAQRHALGRAAVVDEHDRRAVLADRAEQLGVDRRPDRAARGSPPATRLERVAAGAGRSAPGSAIDSTGTSMRRSSGLRDAGVDDRHLARGADEEAADLLERALGGAEPDALDALRTPPRRSATSASRRSSVSARCAPRLECATAWISSTITASTPREHLARAAR